MIQFKNKKIAILGAQSSGIAMARYAQRQGAKVEMFEESFEGIIERARTALKDVPVTLHARDQLAASDLHGFDGIILTGIIPQYREAIASTKQSGIPIESDMELACRLYNKPIIAVTGSNGKTTVCKMLEFMLKADGKKTLLVGGEFTTFGDSLFKSEPFDLAIVLASPVKLSLTDIFKPEVAIFLNIYPGLAEKFKTLSEYGDVMSKVFKQQGPEDYCIYPSRGLTKAFIQKWKCQSKIFQFDRNHVLPQGSYYLRKNKTIFYSGPKEGSKPFPLEGNALTYPQLIKNFLPAICAGKILGVKDPAVKTLLKDFEPLPHRMEMVKKIHGNLYINDAKSKNVAAIYYGLTYLPDKKVILVAGGEYMALQYYQGLIPRLKKKVKALVIFGEHREKFNAKWGESTQTFLAPNLEQAMQIAFRQISGPEDVILFSPGARSERYFHASSYQRGDEFKKIVQRISEMDVVRQKVLSKL